MHRGAARVLDAQRTTEGEGVSIRRSFPTRQLEDVDPFLLLDEMGPTEIAPGSHTGFPDHPHRGFETVTYLLEGEMEHRDSRGNHGILRPGGVQWMTAGAGLVHSEMPGSSLQRTGGLLHGFQLWVNLPRADKMVAPRYQDLPAASLPVAYDRSGLVQVRIIAGESLGSRALIETHTPITYLHFTLQPGGEHIQDVPQRWNAFAYIIGGDAEIGETAVKEGQLVILARDAETVMLRNLTSATQPANILLIAGRPLGETVARWGPFVMNSREEIAQAVEDYRAGRMGNISR
jgi:redox-sensitive bicupin YhaK (pirin superfamily)